jgi:bifunctional oligoribonuclease and PAP phosphatase NrnA
MELLGQLLEQIKKHDTIIIHRHTRPDGDCMGSQIGMKELIKTNFPSKKVYAVGEELKKLQWIDKMDQISDELYEHALVILLDVANKSRISDHRYQKAHQIIRIDHHPQVEQIGQLEWIDPSYSSCCEMIIDFYHPFDLKMSEKGLIALYYGIITDTNRFSNPNINHRTLKLASKVLEGNLDIKSIYSAIYNEPLQVVRLKGQVMKELVTPGNGLGYYVIDRECCQNYQVDSTISNTLANSLSYIEGIKIWFIAIAEKDTEQIRVSIRSEDYPINQLAAQFGGGGHRNASGVILKSQAEIPQLVNAISNYLESIK